MVFEIPLAEQKVKPHQVTALHLITGFGLLAFSAMGLLVNNTVMTLPGSASIEEQQATIHNFDTLDKSLSVVLAVAIIILFVTLFRNKWLRQPTANKIFRVCEMIVTGAIAVYMLTRQFNVPAALFGLLTITLIFSLFWETGKKTNIDLHLSHEGIKLPITSRRKHINWPEVEKVLLRHGTITINCADNRMYQWVTAPHNTDTEIFEAFCDAQIEASRKDRKEDW